MVERRAVLADLDAESNELDGLVAGLGDQQWSLSTPAEGWTIAHQIAHLAWTDDQARFATTRPDEFIAELEHVAQRGELLSAVDASAAAGAKQPPRQLLAQWRAGRAELRDALAALPDGAKVPWFGPPMSAASMATARIMETWAHGQDVRDALGRDPEESDRLRHIAHLGVGTMGYAFLANGRQPPDEPVRVDLRLPSGAIFTTGPDDADNRVKGRALDFCLAVTQRRHPDDLDLAITGDVASEWMRIAQAFAGPPGPGREPGQFEQREG